MAPASGWGGEQPRGKAKKSHSIISPIVAMVTAPEAGRTFSVETNSGSHSLPSLAMLAAWEGWAEGPGEWGGGGGDRSCCFPQSAAPRGSRGAGELWTGRTLPLLTVGTVTGHPGLDCGCTCC